LIRLLYFQHQAKEIFKAMPEYNYDNHGWMNPVGGFKVPSLTGIGDPNKLVDASKNNLASIAGKLLPNLIPGGEIISQVLNLIPSIFQGIIGGSQLNKANQIERENPHPTAEIAPSVNKLVNYSYGQTLNQDIPGGGIARDEIKGATAAGIRAASELGSGSEAYGALGEMVGRQQGQFANLAQLTAQDVASKQGAYENALGTKAQEENRVWDWNKAQPYLQAAQVAAQLRDSGMKNLYSGGANVFGSLAEATSPDFNSSLLNGSKSKGSGGNVSMEELAKWIQSMKTPKSGQLQ
jgi:hypothetical protein